MGEQLDILKGHSSKWFLFRKVLFRKVIILIIIIIIIS